MFSGRVYPSIDAKGRVSIPARFREVLERDQFDRVFITNFIFEREHCLALYPPNEWQRLIGRIEKKPSFDRNVQLFQTFFIGGAHETQVDSHGRILVPPKLREFARLDREVTFSAMTDHFQLWDKAVLERVLAAAEQSFADGNFFKDLDL